MNIKTIEARFKKVAKLEGDLSQFPLPKTNHLQVKTDKSKSDTFGEVFTPLWLVDEMILKAKDSLMNDPYQKTMDLCAGYGQFTVRLIRALTTWLGRDFNLGEFMKTHYFSEFQKSSSYKLMCIFGSDINLFIGDAQQLKKLTNLKYVGIYLGVGTKDGYRWRKDNTGKLGIKQNFDRITTQTDLIDDPEKLFTNFLDTLAVHYTNSDESECGHESQETKRRREIQTRFK